MQEADCGSQEKQDIEICTPALIWQAIYNGMDLANVNGYYGDKKVMLSMPEISSYVFTADLNKDLASSLQIHRSLALC